MDDTTDDEDFIEAYTNNPKFSVTKTDELILDFSVYYPKNPTKIEKEKFQNKRKSAWNNSKKEAKNWTGCDWVDFEDDDYLRMEYTKNAGTGRVTVGQFNPLNNLLMFPDISLTINIMKRLDNLLNSSRTEKQVMKWIGCYLRCIMNVQRDGVLITRETFVKKGAVFRYIYVYFNITIYIYIYIYIYL